MERMVDVCEISMPYDQMCDVLRRGVDAGLEAGQVTVVGERGEDSVTIADPEESDEQHVVSMQQLAHAMWRILDMTTEVDGLDDDVREHIAIEILRFDNVMLDPDECWLLVQVAAFDAVRFDDDDDDDEIHFADDDDETTEPGDDEEDDDVE